MKKIQTFSIILFAMIISACSKEPHIANREPKNKNEITFSVALPSQGAGIKTYALGNIEENALYTVDVLAFKVNTNETETFAYKVQATHIGTPDAGQPANKTFKASLVKGGTQKYRFVLLANVRSILNGITINADELKSDVLEKLVGAHEDFDGKWNVDPANYTPLPMWGESDKITIDESTASISGLSLLRSVARIDIQLISPAITNFKITSVIMYATKYNGLIAPRKENYNPVEKKVTAASIPSFSQDFAPIIYEIPEPGTSLLNTIYTFEAAAEPVSSPDATALVIGGIYNGSGIETYYRIDFLDNTATPLSILRNHKYTINIAKVGGPGYRTQEAAWTSKAVNMEVNITPFNEGGINEIVFDGQYLLGVNKDVFNFSYPISTGNQISVFTDHASGWAATTNDSWITITANSGNSGVQGICRFNIAARKANQLSRTGTITLKAGRLSKVISITQAGSPPPPAPGTFVDVGLNFYIYKTDLPDATWNTYANVAAIPAFTDDVALHQLIPAVAKSCASLGENWRLPDYAELKEMMPANVAQYTTIKNAIVAGEGTSFVGNWYWSSTSFSTTVAYPRHGGTPTDADFLLLTKTSTGSIARCIYSK